MTVRTYFRQLRREQWEVDPDFFVAFEACRITERYTDRFHCQVLGSLFTGQVFIPTGASAYAALHVAVCLGYLRIAPTNGPAYNPLHGLAEDMDLLGTVPYQGLPRG